MSLQEQIKDHMKEAMKAKETDTLTVLRGLLSAFTNELVAKGKTPQGELGDEGVIEVIQREAKRRKDSIKQFTEGDRDDLAESEKKELEVLEKYLPEMMTIEEIEKVVAAKKEALGVTDQSQMGQLMGAVMGELKGKADGGDVKRVVEQSF
jgi:hypothetical protein